MKKFTKTMTRILALVLICALVLPFAACRKDPGPSGDPSNADPSAAKKMYTVAVQTAGGMPLEGVGVYVYEDETCAELVWFDTTGADGKMTFTDVERNSYVAVLADVPAGYTAEEVYPITGDVTTIVLETAQAGEDVQDVVYKLGDMVMDFTLTGADGTEYTLSQLLQQKKAVVLNFWYIECGPCNAEFPFLQEAYEQHRQDIEILALNPVNTAEQIAAFQAEKGYTFPMLSCDSDWQRLFNITAYPTTVIIDRFGNICLIHRGAIDTAKTFADAFAYFAAEDYTPQLIEDITSLETEEEAGTSENPNQMGGQSSFQITVEPGQEVYTELYKAKGMYMSIHGKDRNFYVLYNDKKYTPDSDGVVGFVVSTGDNYTPALFAIGNSGSKTQTYQVYLGHLAGTFNNPYDLKLGEFTAKVSAGNEQGVYYRGTAPADGTFVVQLIEAPAGVEYDFSLQSMDVNKTVLRNYRGDGSVDEATGYPTIRMSMTKGMDVMFSVGTLPDDSNNYPGGTFRFLVTFEEGNLKEEEKAEELDYTVTVTDEAGQPMADVTVWLTKGTNTASAKTDAAGLATFHLVKDTYTATLSIPAGYTLAVNSFELTPEAPAVNVTLTTAVDTRVDYTVTVQTSDGTPVEGVEVLVVGAGSALTDATGTVSFKLEPGNYTVLPGVLPEGLTCTQTLILTAETTSGTLTLTPPADTRVDYTVTVQNVFGEAVEGVEVKLGTLSALTDATGTVSFKLEPGNYTVKPGTLPAGYTCTETLNLTAEVLTGVLTLEFALGTEQNPILLTEADHTVTNAATVWYASRMGGAIAKVTGKPGFTVQVGTEKLTDTDGTVEFEIVTENPFSPAIFAITGDGDYRVTFTYPAGHQMNPAQLVIGMNTAVRQAGDTDYYYTWTAIGDGKLTITMDAAAQWTYALSNQTAGIFGDTHWSDDETPAVTQTIQVSTGDVIQLTVNTYDPADMFQTPAGNVTFRAEFTWPVAQIPFTTAVTPAGTCYGYEITDAAEAIVTIEDADAYVIYGTTTYRADAAGLVKLTLGTEETALLIIGNGGTASESYKVNFAWPEGHKKNPTVLPCETKQTVLTLDTVHFYGYYSTMTATIMGTVTFTVPAAPAGAVFDLTLTCGDKVITSAADDAARTVSVYVFPGDVLQLQLKPRPVADSIYPAGDYTLSCNVTDDNAVQTVTFDPNGGVLTGAATAETNKGRLNALPSDPTREDHAFLGWFDAPTGGKQITLDTVYTADTTVYAQWLKTKHQVTFDVCGGTLAGETTATTTDCKLAVLPVPTRENYKFLGWFDAPTGGKQITLDTAYTMDTTVYAQWSKIEYQVSFDACGGTLEGAATVTTTDRKLASLPTPTRENYSFNGWFDAAAGGSPVTPDTVYAANTTIYAQWTRIECQVTFHANGGTLEGAATITTVDGKLASLPTATREGYTFAGWFDAATGGNQVTLETIYTVATTLYAHWTEVLPSTATYTVFVVDGSGNPVTGSVYVTWQGDTTVTKAIGDASGSVSATLNEGTYTVVLTLTGAYADCQYVSVTVTAENPVATVQLAGHLPADVPVVENCTGGAYVADFAALEAPLGATYVKLDASQRNYTVVGGTGYCFFYFPIAKTGKYSFTTSGAAISDWGVNDFYIYNSTTEAEKAENLFFSEVKDAMFHEGMVQYFAVEVTDAHPGTILLIQDEGEANFTVHDAPYIIFKGTQTPEVTVQNGKAVAIEKNIFKLTDEEKAKTLTYVDMLNDKPVKGADGFYHLGTEDGPILYVNLGTGAPYYSLAVVTGAVGQFGTGFRKVFFNPDGTPEMNPDGTFRKEDYTDAMIAYSLHIDPTTGIYPLTDDLIYMIQNGCETLGWFDPTSANYLLSGKDVTVDPTLLWMFAVCYLK